MEAVEGGNGARRYAIRDQTRRQVVIAEKRTEKIYRHAAVSDHDDQARDVLDAQDERSKAFPGGS
ncbi:hypothetical protein [Fodinicola feengrottensis]|uniref:hypothetical protein n=1 Tax=Fodinicola feengrottensis TaxID=435914 RepID=UPI0024410FFA|nr:hypothetical protein [Fodinicola feengrottensis]